MSRVPFLVVALEVEKLYQKVIAEDNDQAIEDHCEFIANYIEATGWQIDEYLERWMQDDDN